ncbi:MAG: 8-oxoguanine DNA glycosylase [Lachnospiraceae bacterium]|nr:8-oxoguanine DNA glycosylase [Lachnospiraceae bacterium]
MYKTKADNLNLDQIAESGQCFRWRRLDEGKYEIEAFGRVLTAGQKGNEFELSCDETEWKEIWYDYFDMDTDYAGIGKLIMSSEDEYLKAAYSFGSGIRILRQELWEMVLTFMISQNNNIKRIRGSVEKLCIRCAKGTHFPSAEEIDLKVFDDTSLGLGYRDVFLREMCAYAKAHPEFPENLRSMDYKEAYETLIGFKGIGVKVANCISLFGLHNIDAFPIDTHIKKILSEHYPDGFDFERYKGVAGIVQQYMFYYDLKH